MSHKFAMHQKVLIKYKYDGAQKGATGYVIQQPHDHQKHYLVKLDKALNWNCKYFDNEFWLAEDEMEQLR